MKQIFFPVLSFFPLLLLLSIGLHWGAVAYQIQGYPNYGQPDPKEVYGQWHLINALAVYCLPFPIFLFCIFWKKSSWSQKFLFFFPLIFMLFLLITNVGGLADWWAD